MVDEQKETENRRIEDTERIARRYMVGVIESPRTGTPIRGLTTISGGSCKTKKEPGV